MRTGEQFCRDLVREWRLRHARVMTCDAPADDGAKAAAVAAVEAHVDAHRPCTVPQLHLPSGCFHPTVEKKQLEHSDVSSAACSSSHTCVRLSCAAGLPVSPAGLPSAVHRSPRVDDAAMRRQIPAPRLPHFSLGPSHVPGLHTAVLHVDCRQHLRAAPDPRHAAQSQWLRLAVTRPCEGCECPSQQLQPSSSVCIVSRSWPSQQGGDAAGVFACAARSKAARSRIWRLFVAVTHSLLYGGGRAKRSAAVPNSRQ